MTADDPGDIYPIERPTSRTSGVPRRFGVGVLLILMTFFAVLFAPLRCLDYGPKVGAVVGVLFVGVAAGQALLFRGRKPREASLLVGAVLFPLEMLALAVYEQVTDEFSRASIVEDIPGGLICSVAAGALLGYLAGCLTAGIFLVMDRLGNARTQAAQPLLELQPFSESDIDTLLEWVDSPRLLALWAGSTFSHPLDRPQLERHLCRASGQEPDLLIFKAGCPQTGRTVGHVELGGIDRELRSATVGLALIGPAESGRGELSIMLLRAILAVAFDRLALHRVQTAVLVSDWQAIACYREAGFSSEGVLRDSLCLKGMYGDQRMMSILRHEWLWHQRSLRGRPQRHAFSES
jgi:RimJ/RimL family protein N-acetyltransferase